MSTELKKIDENKFEVILERIINLEQMGMQFPTNYSVENAMRSAWLILQETVDMNKKPALEVCSPQSVAYAMQKMVTKGLNPQKNQCYFIVRGNKLCCDESYFGEISIGKRAGLKDVRANVVLEGDEFNFSIGEDGKKKIDAHKQSFESLGGKILGAYCVVTFPDGSSDVDIMSLSEIEDSWSMGGSKGNSPAHKKFSAEMCKKTVTRRAIKVFVNSSDDSSLFIEDTANYDTPTEAHVKHEINTKANKKQIGFDNEVDYEEVKDKPSAKDEDSENQKIYEEAMEEESQPKPQTSGAGF